MVMIHKILLILWRKIFCASSIKIGKVDTVTNHHSTRALEGGGSYSISQDSLHPTSLTAGGELSLHAQDLMTKGVVLEAQKLKLEVQRWGDTGVTTTVQDRRVEPGRKEDAVYTGATSTFHASRIQAQAPL